VKTAKKMVGLQFPAENSCEIKHVKEYLRRIRKNRGAARFTFA
jgi:hypothetical protein